MAQNIESSWVEVEVGDGTQMKIYCAWPKSDFAKRGIMVFQEAFGVNSHIRDIVHRFAKEGFFAVSPDFFHRTADRFEGNYADFAAIGPHFQGLTKEKLEFDIRATYQFLTDQTKTDAVAAIGYCMGGRAAFVANSILPLNAAISYYAGRVVPDYLPLAALQQADILFFWGGLDKNIPISQIRQINDALTDAGKAYTSVGISNADHGFFCDERTQFNARAAEESWAHTLAFLNNRL